MSQMELVEAIKSGNAASVKELIEGGAPLDQQDKQGWLPLNWAAGSGQLEMVELLLQHGADPLAVGRDLRTPQMIALAAGHRPQPEMGRTRRDTDRVRARLSDEGEKDIASG